MEDDIVQINVELLYGVLERDIFIGLEVENNSAIRKTFPLKHIMPNLTCSLPYRGHRLHWS